MHRVAFGFFSVSYNDQGPFCPYLRITPLKDAFLWHMIQVWLPDVSVRNSAGQVRNKEWVDNVHVSVNSQGTVYYIIRSEFKVTCGLDLTSFPGDTQVCPIFLTLQSYWVDKVNLTYSENLSYIDTSTYDHHGEWDLISSSVHRGEYAIAGTQSHMKFAALAFKLTYKRLVSIHFCVVNVVEVIMMMGYLKELVAV